MTRWLTVAALALAVAARAQDDPGPKPPTFTAPKGWKAEKAGLFTAARFRIGQGDEAAAVTVSGLAKDGGGVAANVNRWRAQVGLGPLKDEEALKAVRPAKVDGLKGHSFDAAGEGTDGKPAQRVVVTFVKRDDVTWYFRLSGPAAVVKEQKAAFDRFLKSVRFANPKKS